MEERLAELQERKKQLTEQEKLIKARLGQQKRKERTRRLIQEGAIFEKYLPIESTTDAEIVCKYLVSHPEIMSELRSLLLAQKPSESDEKGSESL